MDFTNPYLIGAIVVIILLVLYIVMRVISKNSKPTVTSNLDFAIEDLLVNIGNVENIESVNSSMSKVTLKLKDTDLVIVEEVKKLGASGIVETKDGFTFIFGSVSPEIEKAIKEKL